MPFTKELPIWNKPGTKPPQSKIDAGWEAADKPPADWFNWLFYTIYKSVEELQQNAANKNEIQNGSTAPTPNTVVLRDSAGRAKVAAPISADDIARKDTVDQAIAALINGSPGALDTLKELADAMGSDPNFAATITNSLAQKLNSSEKGTANGVASLGSDGKVPASQLNVTQPQDASTTQKGLVQLTTATNSTSTTLVPTASALKTVSDRLGVKITVGTTAPTSPATNDIWIQV